MSSPSLHNLTPPLIRHDSQMVAEAGLALTPEKLSRDRNLRVVISEELFVHLHDMANESRMRFQHYLRRYLAEAHPFPPDKSGSPAFSTRIEQQ